MDDLHTTLEILERKLLALEVRSSREKASDILASGFREFGKSGNIGERDEIIASMAEETRQIVYRIEDFGVRQVGQDAALSTYTAFVTGADGLETKARRSSVWERSADGRWRMVFHQGTPTE